MNNLKLFLFTLMITTHILFAQPEGKLIDSWLVYGVADQWIEGLNIDINGILSEALLK